MSDQLIICNHNHKDCFAYYPGEKCQLLCKQILVKDCPFYKTTIEYELGIPHRNTTRTEDIIERM